MTRWLLPILTVVLAQAGDMLFKHATTDRPSKPSGII